MYDWSIFMSFCDVIRKLRYSQMHITGNYSIFLSRVGFTRSGQREAPDSRRGEKTTRYDYQSSRYDYYSSSSLLHLSLSIFISAFSLHLVSCTYQPSQDNSDHLPHSSQTKTNYWWFRLFMLVISIEHSSKTLWMWWFASLINPHPRYCVTFVLSILL